MNKTVSKAFINSTYISLMGAWKESHFYRDDSFWKKKIKGVFLSATVVQMDNCTETRLMFDSSVTEQLREFD